MEFGVRQAAKLVAVSEFSVGFFVGSSFVPCVFSGFSRLSMAFKGVLVLLPGFFEVSTGFLGCVKL